MSNNEKNEAFVAKIRPALHEVLNELPKEVFGNNISLIDVTDKTDRDSLWRCHTEFISMGHGPFAVLSIQKSIELLGGFSVSREVGRFIAVSTRSEFDCYRDLVGGDRSAFVLFKGKTAICSMGMRPEAPEEQNNIGRPGQLKEGLLEDFHRRNLKNDSKDRVLGHG